MPVALAQELLKNHAAAANTSDLDGMTPLMVGQITSAIEKKLPSHLIF